MKLSFCTIRVTFGRLLERVALRSDSDRDCHGGDPRAAGPGAGVLPVTLPMSGEPQWQSRGPRPPAAAASGIVRVRRRVARATDRAALVTDDNHDPWH